MRLSSICFIIFFLFSGAVFGTISANYSPCAYQGGCPEAINKTSIHDSVSQINTLVILGAGHFLKSHSDLQLFLNKYELSQLSGINYNELQSILNDAVIGMENARDTYFDLKTVASSTDYNKAVIADLHDFDYEAFHDGRNLNPVVFKEVVGYLSKGDVTGSYIAIYSKVTDILERLNGIKRYIDNNSLPEVSLLWELNQEYSNALLFGQYIASVFKSII